MRLGSPAAPAGGAGGQAGNQRLAGGILTGQLPRTATLPRRSSVKRFALVSILTLVNELFPSYTKLQVGAVEGRRAAAGAAAGWRQSAARMRRPTLLLPDNPCAPHATHHSALACRAWSASSSPSTWATTVRLLGRGGRQKCLRDALALPTTTP